MSEAPIAARCTTATNAAALAATPSTAALYASRAHWNHVHDD